MIVLFTDYGHEGPYLGQVEAVLSQRAPNARVIRLFVDAPSHNPRACAYLLAAYSSGFPQQAIFFTVVDPGVGSFTDRPVILKIDNQWFVGPDNGLFDIVARRGQKFESWQISWRPETLSSTFHGRDLYAPVCAMIFNHHSPPGETFVWTDQHGWPDDLNEIVYIDRFGNAMTGIRAAQVGNTAVIKFRNQDILNARTFSDVVPGSLFWFENSGGLVEIAVNQGSAAEKLGMKIGDQVKF